MPGSALGQGTKGLSNREKIPAMVGVCLLVGEAAIGQTLNTQKHTSINQRKK